MKKFFLLVAAAATIVTIASAQTPRAAKVPAYPGMIERVQPNGDTIRTYLRGDERMHWLMTEDGWQIKENKCGWLVYVKQNCKGGIRITCRKAHNAEERSECEMRWLNKHGIQKKINSL